MNNSNLSLNNNIQNIHIVYPPIIPQFPVLPLQQGLGNQQRTIQIVPRGNPLGSLPIDSHTLFPTDINSLPRDAVATLLETLKSWFPQLIIPSIDAILLHTPLLDEGYEHDLGYFPFKFDHLILRRKVENTNNEMKINIDQENNKALRALFIFLKKNPEIRNHFIEILDDLEFALRYKNVKQLISGSVSSGPRKLANFDWGNETNRPEILRENAHSLIESFYLPLDNWDIKNGVNQIINAMFTDQNHNYKFACLFYEYEREGGHGFPFNYYISGEMNVLLLEKAKAIAFKFIIDFLGNLEGKKLHHYLKRFKPIRISMQIFYGTLNYFTLEEAIKFYQNRVLSANFSKPLNDAPTQEIPSLLINNVSSQERTLFENSRSSNLASSSNLDTITFDGTSLLDLMHQLKTLCPSSIFDSLESHPAFTSSDGCEHSMGYFPFKIEAISFKDSGGRLIQINPANEKSRLLFHELLRYLKNSLKINVYFAIFFKTHQLTFSLNYKPEIIEKVQSAGYDLNSLRILTLQSFDWYSETNNTQVELREKFYNFFLELQGTLFDKQKKRKDLALSLAKELFHDETELLAYAFHFLQMLHNGVGMEYPSLVIHSRPKKNYLYSHGPLLAILLKKVAFSSDCKKKLQTAGPLDKWRADFSTNPDWSFSFQQLIDYMAKTGKDVFPMTPEIAEHILSSKGRPSKQESKLPIALSAQRRVLTRTTSAMAGVIPSSVTLGKRDVPSLGLLLKENPTLKAEAEKMFSLLVDSVFLEKELMASNLLHARGSWRFTLDSSFSEMLKNVLTTFLKGHPANNTLALSIIQYFLNYFPLRASFTSERSLDLQDLDKDRIIELLNKYQRTLASHVSLFPIESDSDLSTQIIPILMRIKKLELKKIPLTQQMDIEPKDSQIPCFLIYGGLQQTQVSFLMAHFSSHGILKGFSIDRENVGKNFLVGKGLMEANLDETVNNRKALTAGNLGKLKMLFKNKPGKQRLPEFLVLEPLSIPTSASQQRVGGKRKKDAIDSINEIESKTKKARIHAPTTFNVATEVKEIHSASSSSSCDEMVIDEERVFKPITDGLQDSTEEMNWDNLWHEMGRRVLQKISLKSLNRSKRDLYSLSLGPLKLPIVDFIHVARSRQMDFVPLNHLLKPYQAETVKKLLISMEAGLSPLLALEMGTGKSWVINEVIAQLIGQGREGTILIILPLSVVSQMAKETENYLALVSASAWIATKADLKPEDLIKFQEQVLENIKVALANEEVYQIMAYLPLFALFDGAELYGALCNSLSSDKKQFWNNLSNILESQLPILLGTEGEQIVNEARAKASQLVLSNEKATRVEWKTYFDGEQLKNLLPGNSIKDMRSTPPLLFAQLRFAGTLMLEALSKMSKIPKQYIPRLREHLSRNTLQCNKNEALTRALKEGKRVIITSYDAFRDTPKETFEGIKVAGLVFDEAQKLHTPDSKLSKTCLAHIRHLKQSHPKLPVILSTATPFENRLSELWTLLQLANPSEDILPNDTFERVTKLIEKAQTVLHTLTKSETTEYPEEAFQAFVTSFAAAEAFRNALSFLVERKKRNDPSVRKDWGGLGPERTDVVIQARVTPLVQAKLRDALADFQKNGFQLLYSHKVNRILLHPSLAEASLDNKKSETIALLESLNSDNTIVDFLEGSPRLSTMLAEPSFVEMITQGEKGLILSEYVAEAEIARLAILSRYPGKVEVKLFTGDLCSEERDLVLEWYKTPSAGISKVLVLMKKAGGVGLNLPEAVKIFRTSDNWNPSVDTQAEDRANRVNKAGQRVFVSMNFNTYHDAHLRSVREVKKAIEAFFHQQNDVDIMTQFRQFCTLLLEQCYQSLLNEQKEVISADEKRKRMETILVDLIGQISVQELTLAIAACQPKLKYPSFLKSTQAGILPLSYKCSYDDAVRQAYLADKAPADWKIGLLLRITPHLREELRKGDFSANSSQEKMAVWNELKSLENQPLTELSLSEIKATHTIVVYAGAPDGQGYQLQKIENPGLPSTLFLYRKQREKDWHYDILNLLA